MGCSGHKALLTEEIAVPQLNKWSSKEIFIKQTVLSFVKENHIEVSLYFSNRVVYRRKFKNLSTHKEKLRLFFFIPTQSITENQSNEVKEFMNAFLNKFPQLKKYYDSYSFSLLKSNRQSGWITPRLILSHDYNSLLKRSKVDWNSKNYLALHFLDLKYTRVGTLNELKQMEKSPLYDSFSIIFSNDSNQPIGLTQITLDSQAKEEYHKFRGFSIIIYKSKVKCWLQTTQITNQLMINLIEPKLNEIDSKAILKEYISTNLANTSIDYEIIFESYHSFTPNHSLSTSETFPIIYQSHTATKHQSKEALIFNTIFLERPNIQKTIIAELSAIANDSQCQISIETFKEKKFSLLSRGLFNYQCNYLVFLSKPIATFNKVRAFIETKLNPALSKENKHNEIKQLIVMPSIGETVRLPYQSKAKCYVMLYYSEYINNVYENIIERYMKIFSFVEVIVFGHKEEMTGQFNETRYHVVDVDSIDTTALNCFFIPYGLGHQVNSHMLLLLNADNKVLFCDFFKNASSIYNHHLETYTKGSFPSRFPLISKDSFMKIKCSFRKIIDDYLQTQISQKTPESMTTNDSFSKYYEQGVYYQPLISIKYNKLLASGNKSYKNYSINLSFFNGNEIQPFEDLELSKTLNELSKYFYTPDSYYSFGQINYLKCKECNAKLSGRVTNAGIDHFKQIRCFVCPITKDVYCYQCEQLKTNYPFNMLFIKCKEKRCLLHLSHNNLDYFRKRNDLLNAPEIKENICDLCCTRLLSPRGRPFYLLLNFTNRNLPFLLCQSCFDILREEEESWQYPFQCDYIRRFCYENYVDLDNLICKKITVSNQ